MDLPNFRKRRSTAAVTLLTAPLRLPFTPCSQMCSTPQPIRRSLVAVCLSLSTFLSNLARQKLTLLFGNASDSSATSTPARTRPAWRVRTRYPASLVASGVSGNATPRRGLPGGAASPAWYSSRGYGTLSCSAVPLLCGRPCRIIQPLISTYCRYCLIYRANTAF